MSNSTNVPTLLYLVAACFPANIHSPSSKDMTEVIALESGSCKSVRFQTVGASIDVEYELLSPDLQSIIKASSMKPGLILNHPIALEMYRILHSGNPDHTELGSTYYYNMVYHDGKYVVHKCPIYQRMLMYMITTKKQLQERQECVLEIIYKPGLGACINFIDDKGVNRPENQEVFIEQSWNSKLSDLNLETEHIPYKTPERIMEGLFHFLEEDMQNLSAGLPKRTADKVYRGYARVVGYYASSSYRMVLQEAMGPGSQAWAVLSNLALGQIMIREEDLSKVTLGELIHYSFLNDVAFPALKQVILTEQELYVDLKPGVQALITPVLSGMSDHGIQKPFRDSLLEDLGIIKPSTTGASSSRGTTKSD